VTDAMKKALSWLKDRGHSGVIDRHGRVLAAGETASFDAATWLRLVASGHVEGGHGRLAINVNQQEQSDAV